MATKKTANGRVVRIEVPEALARRLDELIRETRRSLNDEIVQALEFWLERQGAAEAAVDTPATPAAPPAEQLEAETAAHDRPPGRRPRPT